MIESLLQLFIKSIDILLNTILILFGSQLKYPNQEIERTITQQNIFIHSQITYPFIYLSSQNLRLFQSKNNYINTNYVGNYYWKQQQQIKQAIIINKQDLVENKRQANQKCL
ncbi:hypothetical protein ABPG74_005486 [Tetrahymena malaccensis]